MKTKWFDRLTMTGGIYFTTNYLRLTTAFLLFLFAIAITASCGGGSGSGDGGGSGGGGEDRPATVVTGPDGVKLSIPGGSVSQDTTYRIARNSDGAPSTDGLILLTPIYAVTPHSQSFAEGALIEIPYDESQIPIGSVPFVLRADAGGQWQAFGNARLANGTAKADISSLSYYAIGVCAQDFSSPGDCPFNSELLLELLDSSGIAIPAQFNSWGQALPVITVDQPTTLRFRATWTRPPNINRTDNISLYLSGGGQLQGAPWREVMPNTQHYYLDFNVYIDPATVSGASGPNGKIVRMRANVWSTYLAFVGPPEGLRNIQWEMQTEIAVRVRHIGPQPTITQQPANQAVTAGQTATFSVAASGSSLTYQWQRSNDNGQSFNNISGATAASYTTATTALSDNGAIFFVRVCEAAACVDSFGATLTVTASSTLPTFTQQPASIAVLTGQTASFTAVAAGPPAPSIQWYKSDGFLGDPVGTPCSSSGSFTACTYTTPALALADSGSQYYATATNSAGSVQSNIAMVTVTSAAVAPSITTEPSDVTVNAGNDTTFSVAANGTAPLSYQWRKNGVNIRGANGANYWLKNAQLADNGAAFSVEVRNSAGRVTSRNAILTVTAASVSGSLDTTFDTDGIVVHNNAAGGNGHDYGQSITTDSSGRILVAGESWNGTNGGDMAIWRYNSNGTLDTTFDTDGIVVHSNAAGGNGLDTGYSITTDSSGRILVAGNSWNGTNNDMAIWRYNSNGSLDTTFDSDGIVVHSNAAGGNGIDSGVSITIDSSGRILVAGRSWNAAGNADMVIWRYLP